MLFLIRQSKHDLARENTQAGGMGEALSLGQPLHGGFPAHQTEIWLGVHSNHEGVLHPMVLRPGVSSVLEREKPDNPEGHENESRLCRC